MSETRELIEAIKEAEPFDRALLERCDAAAQGEK